MTTAKDLILKPITRQQSLSIIEKHHYSGKQVNNSGIFIGAYYHGRLEGTMELGPSTDKRRMMGIVEGTGWNNFLELNRMAFSPNLPRNSESRALAILARVLRKHAPAIKWIVSFADGTQCGDGTIYRAAGFHLIQIKRNDSLIRLPDGTVIHKIALASTASQPRPELGGRSFLDITGGKYSVDAYIEATGGERIEGYQLKYIKFIDPTWEDRLTVPILPYSAIDEVGARMYMGERGSVMSAAVD